MKTPERSLLSRLLRPVFGDIKWSPPPWPGRIAGTVRRHPRAVTFTVLGLAAAGWGGWKWWEWAEAKRLERLAWEEAHRPRPDKVENVIRDVTVTPADPQPPALNTAATAFLDAAAGLRFDGPAAPRSPANPESPLDGLKLPEEPVPGIVMEPAHDGAWRWLDDQLLAFQPSKPWPSGVKYKVTLPDDLKLHPSARLKQREYTFTSAPLTAQAPGVSFYTDPSDPGLHQVVAELRFSHPVDPAAAARLTEYSVAGGTPVFVSKNGQTPSPLFRLVADPKDPQRHFWARSVPVTIPAKEDFVIVTLKPGLTIAAGGEPIKTEVTGRTTVPDIYSGLRITETTGTIIRDDEGEPAQHLYLHTQGIVAPAVMPGSVEIKQLPEKPGDDPQWQSAGELTAEARTQAKNVKWSAVENDGAQKDMHIFRLDPLPPGQLLVRVKKGTPGLGGFLLAEDFESLVTVPDFPKELSFTGKGGLLALNGERKVSVKARGVSHIRYTLARVPAAQINHLASMTRGRFESPVFRSSAFGKENISRIRQEVVNLEKPNDHQAVWSAFDFRPATTSPEGAAESARGLFFLTAEAVRPRPKKTEDGEEEGEEESVEVSTEDEGESEEEEGDDGEGDWLLERSVASPDAEDSEDESGESEGGIYSAPSRFVLVTDLGLLVKQNADKSRDVFVQSVSAGGPVAKVSLSVVAKNGTTVATAETDAEGHARFDSVAHLKQDMKPVALVARRGEDLAFMPWDRDDRKLDFSRFSTEGAFASDAQALDAFVFTERGIYRPGDTVRVGMAVRPRGWEGQMEGVPVRLEVHNPAGRVSFTNVLKLSADGFLETDGQIMETEPTGIYFARLMLGGEDDTNQVQLGRAVFRVEDFQPDRMTVALSLPGEPAGGWRTEASAKGVLEVKTLFGFPAADRRVTARMMVQPAWFSSAQFPDHTFYIRPDQRDHELLRDNREINLGETKTGEDGKAVVDLGLERFAAASVAYTLFTEAFEPDGGRSVAASVSGRYSPLKRVAGYKADGDLNYIGQDVARTVHLVCVGEDGKAQAAPDLKLRLVQSRYVSVLAKQDSGNFAYTSTLKETTLSEQPFPLAAEGTNYTLPTNATGMFRLELFDEAANVICAVPWQVAGKGNSGRSLERNAELELRLARGEWKAGEEIECSLSAPFTGAGLLTIEREKVMAWKWFRAEATDSVQKIAVPEALEGSAYVSASFVRALDSPEVFMSPLSYAVAPFRANVDRHRTEVHLDCPPVTLPGSVLKIGLRSGAPSRAVVYAVDEGIHQITDYELPQPLDFFLRKRALEVETHQIVDLILPEFTILGRSRAFGGDGEGDGVSMTLNPFKRKAEAPVVYWSGIVETGPDRRELEYAVPDYFAGQLTIMAVAAGGAHLGAAETKTIVRGPFVLTPNTPLFAAPGDTFTASLTIANNNQGGQEQIHATLTGSDNLEILQPVSDPVTIPYGREGTVRFQVRAKEPLGNAELTFMAEAGGVTGERKTTLSIRPASPRVTTLQTGWFRTPEYEVKVSRNLHDEFAERKTSISALPLNVAAGLEKWLHQFPHGCTEQLVSRAFARTILADEAGFGFDRAVAAKDLEAVFTILRTRQSPDGGFGLWGRGQSDGFDLLTPYVAQFLTEAKEAGFAVPQDLLDGALKKLRLIAGQTPSEPREEVIVARAIYVLTRNGEVTTNYLLNLQDIMDRRAKKEWPESNAAPWVASVLSLLKKDDEAQKLINTWLASVRKAKPSNNWTWYDEQPLATRALGLTLLSRHFPAIAGNLNPDDLQPVMDGLTRSEYNTWSASACVMALKAWSGLQKNSGISVSLHETGSGPVPALLAPVDSGMVQADFTAGAKGILFGIVRPAGSPDMGAYYQIVESGFDRQPGTDAVRNGLEIARSFTRGGKDNMSLAVGEETEAVIRIRNLSGKPQRDLALVDLMPCGFEVAAGSLRPGPRGTANADSVDLREDRNIFYLSMDAGGIVEIRYRLKPVCAGKFVVPPVSISSMYDHAVQARGPAAMIEVVSHAP